VSRFGVKHPGTIHWLAEKVNGCGACFTSSEKAIQSAENRLKPINEWRTI